MMIAGPTRHLSGISSCKPATNKHRNSDVRCENEYRSEGNTERARMRGRLGERVEDVV